ncbi:B3 domain-containing protein [Trifolium medium]|uniref:B3 domain-containing protein n=1 Tax=Trifolium medium TaxID=97028 RepID=A0A392N3F6_9FABA|nr:B3 domain-containing protein [Trifolium medium]
MEEEQPSLPLAFKEKIEQMKGVDVKLVIQKKLTMSDVKGDNSRFYIPIDKKIEESILLTPSERLSLNIYVPQKKRERLVGISISMLDYNLKIWDDMYLKKWKMGKSEIYNITGGWDKLVVENYLEESQKIQLWSFRCNDSLNFALVNF